MTLPRGHRGIRDTNFDTIIIRRQNATSRRRAWGQNHGAAEHGVQRDLVASHNYYSMIGEEKRLC